MHRFSCGFALALLAGGLALPAHAGGFIVGAAQYESAPLAREAERLRRSGQLEAAVAGLNAQLRLPEPVTVRLVECGESNAYYDPESREIQICLELMDDMAGVLEGQFEDPAVEKDALSGAWLGTLLHEVGHALVDLLELPITGREEDVVDQLSAWLLIKAGDTDAVLGYAAAYYSEDGSTDGADFAGVHSLNEQRYFNLLCWAYGSEPDAGAELTASWELPAARAELCADEFAQMDRAWSRLLREHLRQPIGQLRLPRPHANGILFNESATGSEWAGSGPTPAAIPAAPTRPTTIAAPERIPSTSGTSLGRIEKIPADGRQDLKQPPSSSRGRGERNSID